MEGHRVVATGAALVDHTVRVNQVVVAHIAPAASVGVERPLGAHPVSPTGLFPDQAVGVSGVVDDDMVHWVDIGRDAAALAVGVAPCGAADHSGLVAGAEGWLRRGVLRAETSVHGVDINAAQARHAAIRCRGETGPHLPETDSRTGIDRGPPMRICAIGRLPEIVVFAHRAPGRPGCAIETGPCLNADRILGGFVRLPAQQHMGEGASLRNRREIPGIGDPRHIGGLLGFEDRLLRTPARAPRRHRGRGREGEGEQATDDQRNNKKSGM